MFHFKVDMILVNFHICRAINVMMDFIMTKIKINATIAFSNLEVHVNLVLKLHAIFVAMDFLIQVHSVRLVHKLWILIVKLVILVNVKLAEMVILYF